MNVSADTSEFDVAGSPLDILDVLDISWPPHYTIRLSLRAKRNSVQISPKRGLEIIFPKRKRPPTSSQIESILQEHRTWIKKHLRLWQKEQHRKSQQTLLPDKICFPALGKEILLEYQSSASLQVRMKTALFSDNFSENKIVLCGAIQNIPKVITCLKKILFREAHKYLIPWLQKISIHTELFFTQASIRSQSSLWGSCTASKKISLNAKLLFLPKELIEYVLIHELCHIRHLNHSVKFWNLVKQFDPHYLAHRRALRHANIYLPRWLDS